MLETHPADERERKEISRHPESSPTSAPKRPTCTTKSCATAASTSTTKAQGRASRATPSSSPRRSASGSITKSRDVETQAVFSLRGKPLNCFGLTKKVVYENEEFNLLQHALNIEDGIEDLRYNNIVVATDADVDGMHIRLLLITFFLQFFPDLVRNGHVYILQTPLFRVRNKKETIYCYNEEEKQKAIEKLRQASRRSPASKAWAKSSPTSSQHFIGAEHPPRARAHRRSTRTSRSCSLSTWARTPPSARTTSSKTSAWTSTGRLRSHREGQSFSSSFAISGLREEAFDDRGQPGHRRAGRRKFPCPRHSLFR